MKTLEANTILETAEMRLKAYQTLREHIAVLKKQFKELANLDDAMTGKGGVLTQLKPSIRNKRQERICGWTSLT